MYVWNILLLGLHTGLLLWLLFLCRLAADAWVFHLLNELVNILSNSLNFVNFSLVLILLIFCALFLIKLLKFSYFWLLCLFFLFQSFYFVFQLLDQPLVFFVSLHLYILLSMKLFYFLCLCIYSFDLCFKFFNFFCLFNRILNKVSFSCKWMLLRLKCWLLFLFKKVKHWFFFGRFLLSCNFELSQWLSYLRYWMSCLFLLYLSL